MSPMMQILMVSCWNRGLGVSHSVVHASGKDKVWPGAFVTPRTDRMHAHISRENMVIEVFRKIITF